MLLNILIIILFIIIKKWSLLCKINYLDLLYSFLLITVFLFTILIYISNWHRNSVIHATELQKVFKFGILRYLVSTPHEYGAVIHGICNPIKNCIFIPMGMESSFKGHDGLMYNMLNKKIESTVQMKNYSGTSFLNSNGLKNLTHRWNVASKKSDFFWVDSIHKDHLIKLLSEDILLLNKYYLNRKILIINSQEFLLNETIITMIQEKINLNAFILEKILIEAEPNIAGNINYNTEAALNPLYDDVYHRECGLRKLINNTSGEEKEFAINHEKNKIAIRNAFFKTGIINK